MGKHQDRIAIQLARIKILHLDPAFETRFYIQGLRVEDPFVLLGEIIEVDQSCDLRKHLLGGYQFRRRLLFPVITHQDCRLVACDRVADDPPIMVPQRNRLRIVKEVLHHNRDEFSLTNRIAVFSLRVVHRLSTVLNDVRNLLGCEDLNHVVVLRLFG